MGDVREAIASVGTANSILATDKRRLEGDLRGMQQELDNFMSQIKNSEEKTKKAMADAGDVTISDHTATEPSVRFNLMNQHFWAQNITIYHKNNKNKKCHFANYLAYTKQFSS